MAHGLAGDTSSSNPVANIIVVWDAPVVRSSTQVWTEHEIDSLIGFGSGPRPSSSWITEISDTEISDKQCDEIDSQELNQGLDSGSQPQKVSRDRAINHAMERENGAIVYLCCGDEAEVGPGFGNEVEKISCFIFVLGERP